MKVFFGVFITFGDIFLGISRKLKQAFGDNDKNTKLFCCCCCCCFCLFCYLLFIGCIRLSSWDPCARLHKRSWSGQSLNVGRQFRRAVCRIVTRYIYGIRDQRPCEGVGSLDHEPWDWDQQCFKEIRDQAVLDNKSQEMLFWDFTVYYLDSSLDCTTG